VYHYFAAQFSFMTVYVSEARAQIQRLVSVVKMATVHEACTTKEHRSVMHFLCKKGVNAKDIHKKWFTFMVGSVCRVKRFTTGPRNYLNNVRKSQMMKRRYGNG
jgi:hypothetical protein